MPWFRVDDTFALHSKTLAAGNPAIGLWVRAGAWSMQQLTDGHVPMQIARALGSAREASALVAAGLWSKVDDGYQFHEWVERQPSKDAVLAQRKADAERQALSRDPDLRDAVRKRDSDTCRYCGRGVNFNDRRGSAGGTYDHVIPNGGTTLENLVVCCRGCNARKGRRTPEEAGMPLRPIGVTKSDSSHEPKSSSRPNPTQPIPSLDTDADASVERAKRATKRPPDFAPSAGHVQLAAEVGIDLRAEWPKFCDYCDANGKTYKDWPAALRNWIRNAATFNRQRGGSRNGIDWDAAFARAAAIDAKNDQTTLGELA